MEYVTVLCLICILATIHGVTDVYYENAALDNYTIILNNIQFDATIIFNMYLRHVRMTSDISNFEKERPSLLRGRITSGLFPLGIGNVCASQSGANEDDIAELMSQKLPSRREGKCLVACIFERLGISEDSLRSRLEDTAFSFLNHLKEQNSPLYDTAMHIILTCGSKMYSSESTDPCEKGFEIMSCGLQEGLSSGIENVFSNLIATNRQTLFPELGASMTINRETPFPNLGASITRTGETLFPDLRRFDVLKIFN